MLQILFENDDLIALNKPEGIAAIPEGKIEAPSLLALLSAYGAGKFYVVHRLDKEVSGVILFAKNAAMHRHLNIQFSERIVTKTYLALVHGRIAADNGNIDKPLREFGSGRMGVDWQRGKASLTEFTVQARFANYTLVQAFPRTGRRHQLRVHFYTIGHPLVGDQRYGDPQIQIQFPRLMLHAQALLIQLLDGQTLALEAPLPISFQCLLEYLQIANWQA